MDVIHFNFSLRILQRYVLTSSKVKLILVLIEGHINQASAQAVVGKNKKNVFQHVVNLPQALQ
jgi:hypothetical protein